MDSALRLQILRAACTDRAFLKESWHLLSPTLFSEREEAIIAEAASSFYSRYEEPIGAMLRSEAGEICIEKRLGAESKKKLRLLFDSIQNGKLELVSVKALSDRLWKLKRSSFYETALSDAIKQHDKGELDAAFFSNLVDRAEKELKRSKLITHDYLSDEELEKRIKQRLEWDKNRAPRLLIEPLDIKIQGLGRGQLGMVMAPPAGGKGLCLVHFAIAYALQGLNVWHITLEDSLDLVEARLDAAISGVPLKRLPHLPNRLRKRFRRQRDTLRGKIKLTDGTDGGYTVTRIEREYQELVREGHTPDAIIIDYDDEIGCEIQFKGDSARRFEFGEIYKRLRRLAKQTNTIVWTASQPGKQAEGKKVLMAKDVAEDYSKIRKVWCCLGIGQVPEQANVKYIYVIKKRNDRMHFGVEIVSDYDRAIFVDPAATSAWQQIVKARASLG